MQTLLKISTNPALKVDGVVGRETRSTHTNASSDVKRVVDSVIQSHGLKVGDLLSPVARITRLSRVMPTPLIRSTIAKWAKEHGVNEALSFAVCEIESGFDPDARSSTGAIGLFQLTSSAVTDVSRKYKGYYPPPGGNWYDLEWNVNVGVRFLRICAGYARVNPSSSDLEAWRDIYGCYNLGVGAYTTWKKAQFSDSTLIASWSSQSAELKQNGIEQYGANVLAKLRSVVA